MERFGPAVVREPDVTLAPSALLAVGRGNYHGGVVRFGGVIVDHGRGLGAEIATFCIEVQGTYAVGTMRACEFHAALNALDAIGFH